MKLTRSIRANCSKALISMLLFCTVTFSGCGDTPDLELRDDLRLRLTDAQSTLARYEAEHREWSTETIAKMKMLSDDMLVDAAKVAEADGKEAVDAFIAGRKTELEAFHR